MPLFFLTTLFVILTLFSSKLWALDYDQAQQEKLFSFSSLQSLIEQKQISSVDETLKVLKELYPSLFENYILMHRSRALQESSATHPRVILGDPAKRILLAYNGHPQHNGYHSIEVIEYFKKERRFELREISFVDSQAQFSKPNPKRCLACHQSSSRQNVDPRPNWEPYSLWPGAYNSDGNMYFNSRSILSDKRILSDKDKVFLADYFDEVKNFEFFEGAVKPHHPRYQILGEHKKDNTTEFTEAVSHHNFTRVVRLMSTQVIYPYYKYSIMAAARCGVLPWPKNREQWHIRRMLVKENLKHSVSFPGFGDGYGALTSFGGAIDGALSPEEEEALEDIKLVAPKYRSRDISTSIQLIFDPFGVDTSDWSMDFRSQGGRFAFRERFGTLSNPQKVLERALVDFDSSLRGLSCKDLERKSLDKLKEFERLGGYERFAPDSIAKSDFMERAREKALNRCTSCHSPQGNLFDFSQPWIPFEDEQALKAMLLLGNKYPRGLLYDEIDYRTGIHATLKEQMPPKAYLDKTERQALLDHLKVLTGR